MISFFRSTGGLVITVLVLIVVLFSGCWFISDVHYSNAEVSLKNQIIAQDDVTRSFYDQMWKILQQQANVTDQYKASFDSIYVGIMQGRYSTDGNSSALMSWIQESNPDFDASMYQSLMRTIEAKRTEFHQQQKQLIDLVREHRNLVETFPSRLFVGDREEPEYHIITSDRTESVYDTNRENDVSLF